MALAQQKFREIILQLLYSQDVASPEEDLNTDLMMAQLEVSKKNVCLAQEEVKKIRAILQEIDCHIASVSTSYSFDRIQVVTRNILRIAVYELLFSKEVPSKVVMAEAIRLSRKFNTPESALFVNALLDQLHRNRLGEQAPTDFLEKEMHTLIQSEEMTQRLAQMHPSHPIKIDEKQNL